MALLQARLLHDYAEIQKHPYPNVALKAYEADYHKACLVLGTEGDPLHLTIVFRTDYPLAAPQITIDTPIRHPNIFNDYICASILNTDEGWTPSYTIKSVAIQLLSFFTSDSLQQDYGGTVNLNNYRLENKCWRAEGNSSFECANCGYSRPSGHTQILEPMAWASWSRSMRAQFGWREVSIAVPSRDVDDTTQDTHTSSSHAGLRDLDVMDVDYGERSVALLHRASNTGAPPEENDDIQSGPIENLPQELLVQICDHMDDDTLMTFARSWGRIGSKFGVVVQFSILRKRELQCFVLKKSFKETQLGIGVRIQRRGRQGTLSSEFDLLSKEAFGTLRVRKSVMDLPFSHFLPLVISRKHYHSVREYIVPAINDIGLEASLTGMSPSDILVAFMSDIVVKLCEQSKAMHNTSALSRVSERAIESYYQLFHILLCLATQNGNIVRKINIMVQGVLESKTEKRVIPNLGQFLILLLLSDIEPNPAILKNLIIEAITRNVVWMLDQKKGAGLTELAYLEADAVSEYRLEKTFEASRTSYTLLMFQNLFRRTINRGSGENRKTLVQMRDDLFDSHGAPPKGTAARLAQRVGQLQAVDNFSDFIDIMGVSQPPKQYLTSLLRGSIVNSVTKGYSVWGISQDVAYRLRVGLDPTVQARVNWPAAVGGSPPWGPNTVSSFFPNFRTGNAAGGGGAAPSRGQNRGRGG